MDRHDVLDVITEETLTARTTNVKRNFALRMAAQLVWEEWFSYDDVDRLVLDIKEGRFRPDGVLARHLLELSGSIDAKTLDVFRDVGVGSPQFGVAGMGAPLPTQPTHNENGNSHPRKRVFNR